MSDPITQFTDSEINPTIMQGCRIAIIGYGSQGRGQALNLRDSGCDVMLGLRQGGPSWLKAESEGWHPLTIEAATKAADVVALLTSDLSQPTIYRESIADYLQPGASLLFAHGFNIHHKKINVPAENNVIMVSPKGSGLMVRSMYQQGSGIPALVAIHQDATGKALPLALGYAWGIGSARAAVLQTSFAEETIADLFSEQTILCGGLIELIKQGFETLVEAGYQPEVAYIECLHEVKLIADMLYDGGLAQMHHYVSETAAFGGLINGPRVIGEPTREAMRSILGEIQSGRFAEQLHAEVEHGRRSFQQKVAEELEHPIEQTGQNVRQLFAWNRINPPPIS